MIMKSLRTWSIIHFITSILFVTLLIGVNFYVTLVADRDLKPTVRYKSNYEIPARILQPGAVDWLLDDDDSSTAPVEGERVLIISIHSDDLCVIVSDYGEPRNIAKDVPLSALSANPTLITDAKSKSSNCSWSVTKPFHSGLFYETILMTPVFLVLNIYVLAFKSRNAGYDADVRIKRRLRIVSVINLAFTVILALQWLGSTF